MRLEIEVPRTPSLHAKANSGGVRASNILGPVDCQTHSGSFQIHDVEAGISAAANSGGIHIARVNGSVTARTHSGGIEVESGGSSIDAEASSGGIRLSQVRPASIRAQTSSGGVTVQTAAGAGYNVTADIGSGRITTPEMTVRGGFSRHHVEGTVRGGGPQLAVRASSGSVRID